MQSRSTRVQLTVGSTNPLWLHGLLDLLHTIATIEVTGVATDAKQLARILSTRPVEVLVIEADLVAQTRALLRPGYAIPRILVVGSRPHAGTRPSFGAYCSCGYFFEREQPREISSIVRKVAFCPLPNAGLAACHGCPVRRSHAPPALPLTERENEVFVRLGWGQGPSEIATELGIQVKTIEAHRESLKRKLGLGSAAALRAAAFAWRDGELLPATRTHAP